MVKIQVKDVKMPNSFLLTMIPLHTVRFTSITDHNIPIPGMCMPAVSYTTDARFHSVDYVPNHKLFILVLHLRITCSEATVLQVGTQCNNTVSSRYLGHERSSVTKVHGLFSLEC